MTTRKGQTWAWLVQRRASELVVGPRDAPRVKASAAKVAPRAQLPSVIISTTAAVAAPVTRPVPMPVISRATPRWLMLLANMNSVEPSRMNSSPGSTICRRPIWSDSEPMVSSVSTTPSTYTENTAVSAVEEKPQACCHTAYSGVGRWLAKMVVKIASRQAPIARRGDCIIGRQQPAEAAGQGRGWAYLYGLLVACTGQGRLSGMGEGLPLSQIPQ